MSLVLPYPDISIRLVYCVNVKKGFCPQHQGRPVVSDASALLR